MAECMQRDDNIYKGTGQQASQYNINSRIMEPERAFKQNSKFSAESKVSNRSSIRSLQRGSWEERQLSLNKHHTLIEVMSLEGSKKSDIYQKMLGEEGHHPQRVEQQSIQKEQAAGFNPFKTVFKMKADPEPIYNRFSYQPKNSPNHICTCNSYCNEQRCFCSLTSESCVEGFCCQQCIQSKSKKVVRSGLFQLEPKVFCTCKKTKCNKKYCTCFSNGVKCNQECSCQDCLNCDKPVKMEVQPSCIVDEQIKKLDMPQSMQFQPPNFRYSANSNR